MDAGQINEAIRNGCACGEWSPVDMSVRDEPTPSEYAQKMIDRILGQRVHDNAGEKDFINHDPEIYAAGIFNAYKATFSPGKPLTAQDVQAFHLIYAHARVMVNMLEGKVLLDKVVDTGGWATVGADWAKQHKRPRS